MNNDAFNYKTIYLDISLTQTEFTKSIYNTKFDWVNISNINIGNVQIEHMKINKINSKTMPDIHCDTESVQQYIHI